MKKSYEHINFDRFLEEPDHTLTEAEEQAYLSRFYRSIEHEQSAPASAPKRFGHASRRRALLIAAVLTMLLGFGAVANAAGWLQLGVLHDGGEMIAVSDSPQYKAAKETDEYWNRIPLAEQIAREKELYGDTRYEEVPSYDEKRNSITYHAPSAYEKKLLKKYNLKYDRTHYYVNSAKEVFDHTGIGNILGDFADIEDLVLNSGTYIYTDQSAAVLTYGGESLKDPYWELRAIPKNVYLSPSHIFISEVERSLPSYKEWDFISKGKFPVKATSYSEEHLTYDANGEERTSKFQTLNFLIDTKTHTVLFIYVLENPKQTLSTQDAEKLIEKFDFSQLM